MDSFVIFDGRCDLNGFAMRYLTNTFVLITLMLSVNVYADCVEGDCYYGKGKYEYSWGLSYEGSWRGFEPITTRHPRLLPQSLRLSNTHLISYYQISKRGIL